MENLFLAIVTLIPFVLVWMIERNAQARRHSGDATAHAIKTAYRNARRARRLP